LFGPKNIFQHHAEVWQVNAPPVSAGLYQIPE